MEADIDTHSAQFQSIPMNQYWSTGPPEDKYQNGNTCIAVTLRHMIILSKIFNLLLIEGKMEPFRDIEGVLF